MEILRGGVIKANPDNRRFEFTSPGAAEFLGFFLCKIWRKSSNFHFINFCLNPTFCGNFAIVLSSPILCVNHLTCHCEPATRAPSTRAGKVGLPPPRRANLLTCPWDSRETINFSKTRRALTLGPASRWPPQAAGAYKFWVFNRSYEKAFLATSTKPSIVRQASNSASSRATWFPLASTAMTDRFR